MTNKEQIIKQLAERYKKICKDPLVGSYTLVVFDNECAKKGFTIDDIKNYIEKEKQEQKVEQTESIKSLKEQLARKTQECKELKGYIQEREVWGDQCEFCKHNDKENCHQNIILDNLKTINSYRKALEEIKKVCIEDTREFADGTQVRYDSLDDILNIINKAKGDN